jgi:2-dehydro-3-deoxygluconokinase
MVLRGLRGEGVDVSAIQVSAKGPTALMIKNRRAGGEPEVFYYRRGSAMSQAGVSTFPEASWSDARVLYLTGITPALSACCREMIEHVVTQAHARGIEVWLDPNHRRKLWTDEEARKTLLGLMPRTAMVLAGLGEGAMLTGSEDPKVIASALLAAGAPQVIVKAGTDGSYYFDGQQQFHAPAFAIERVVDPIGAGDAFGAGVLSARLEGLSWPEALLRGNALGAMACLTQGDWEGLPTRRELEDFLARRSECVR